jgi:hypothetical protein
MRAQFVYVERNDNYHKWTIPITSFIAQLADWLPFEIADFLLFCGLKFIYLLDKSRFDYSHESERQVFLLKDYVGLRLINVMTEDESQTILEYLQEHGND